MDHKKILYLAILLSFIFFTCKKNKPEELAHSVDLLFELIQPSHSGINFVQKITEEYRYNFSVDANIFNGGGVGVLDVNNDGLQDLLFTSRLQPCKLYVNKGDFKFEDISDRSGITEFIGIKTGVVIIDINADGWDDVYVCRTFLSPIPERRNLLFVNNHDNTFTEKAAEFGLDDISPTQHAHFFDYDLDGDLDCYILNHPVDYRQINNIDFQPSENMPYAGMRPPLDAYESDKLLKNENGKFVNVSESAGIMNRAWGLSVMSADFNDDGFPDIYVANDFIMPDFLYINNGDGTFTDKMHDYFQHITNHAMGIEIADLNNDGLSEVTALDMLGESWERRHRQMTTMQLERYKQLIRQGYGDQQMRNTLQLNNGGGHFSEIGCLADMYDTEWSWAPLAADFDNNGWKDLFITNGVRRDLNDIDFFVFTADSINRTGGISEDRFKKFEDFSNLMPSEKIRNRMFKNSGQLQLDDVSVEWGFGDPTFSNGAAYADFDNDGDLDLIVHNIEDVPFLYKNLAVEKKLGNWLQVKCVGSKENPKGVGAKVSVFGESGLIAFQEISPVRGFYSSVEPIFQIGLGAMDKIREVRIVWPDKKVQVLNNVIVNQRLHLNINDAKLNSDVNKNQSPIFFRDITQSLFIHQENNFEDFNRERLLPRRYSNLGPAIAKTDINGDGNEDLFIGGAAGQAGAIFTQSTNGQFVKMNQPALDNDHSAEDTGAIFFDIDNDGDQDLYVVSGGNEWPASDPNYQDRLYLNNGEGLFQKSEELPFTNFSGKAIIHHDIDNDGDQDLLIGGRVVPGRFPERPRSILMINENGVLRDATADLFPQFSNMGMVTDLNIGDLNNDGVLELVVIGEWMPISIFEIKEGRIIEQSTIPNSEGWWNTVETADLDQDGDLDIIAGNLGLNSRFEPPLHLYANDFDQNGSIDPILCVEEEGRQLPVPMRDDLIKQLPYLKKKFVRNTNYAKADIEAVFSEKELMDAMHLQTNVLATSWFENRNGQFVKHAFPDYAQIAPIFGIEVTDVNQDGFLDLILVGNDSGFDVQTGPLDTSSGILLLNNGKGVFDAVPPYKSGLRAIAEARGIISLASEGRTNEVFVVPNNGSGLYLFENIFAKEQ